MSRIGLMLFAAATLAASARAQTQPAAQASTQSNTSVSADVSKQGGQASANGSSGASGAASAGNSRAALAGGSTINAELNAPLDSKKCKPGDPVKARTTQPAKSGGRTVLPKGTRLVGHVTRASSRARGDSESAMGIVFDKAILKNGEEVPLNVAIQAIASSQASAAGGFRSRFDGKHGRIGGGFGHGRRTGRTWRSNLYCGWRGWFGYEYGRQRRRNGGWSIEFDCECNGKRHRNVKGSSRRIECRRSANFWQPRRFRLEGAKPELSGRQQHAGIADYFGGEERASRQRHADVARFAGRSRSAGRIPAAEV